MWYRRRTAEQGAERYMGKLIAAEKARAGLRHAAAAACPNVTGWTKERIIIIVQSKRVRRAGSFVIIVD